MDGVVKINKVLGKLRENGIKKASADSVGEVEKFLGKELENLIKTAKEILMIKGKKKLDKEEVIESVKKITAQREQGYEI